MPTIEELEALTREPELPKTVAPQQAVQPPQGPTLSELTRITEPRLDYTLDGASPIDKAADFEMKFDPAFSPKPEPYEPDYREALPLQSQIGLKILDPLRNVARGFNNVIFGTIKAPGDAAEALLNATADTPEKRDSMLALNPQLTGLLVTNDLIKKLQKATDPTPPTYEHWYEQIPEAAGSAAAFLVGGKASGATTAAGQSLVSGSLGAASGATSQYEEAIAMGADPEEALLAFGGGAAFGATEGIPGFYFLKKLNKLGLGQTITKLQNFGMNGESSVLRESIKGALTEMGQEGLQTVGGNWVASDLAGYDPTRTLGENFWDSVLTAGVVGSTLAGGTQMLHDADVNEAKKIFEDDYQRRLMSGDPINALATPGGGFGSFTPVDTLLQLNHMKATLDRHIDQKAESALQDLIFERELKGQGPIEFPSEITIDPMADETYLLNPASTVPSANVMDAPNSEKNFIGLGGDTLVNRYTEKALPKGLTAREALNHTDVVTLPTQYDNLLARAEYNLKQYEAVVADPNSVDLSLQVYGDSTTTTTLELAKKMVNIYKLRVEEFKKKRDIANTLLRHGKDYMAAFRAAYNPDMKMILRDTPHSQDEASTKGWFSGAQNITLNEEGKTSPVGIMFIRMEPLVQEIYNGGAKDGTVAFRSAKRHIFEVINHELGHSVLTKHFHDVLNKITTGDAETSRNAYKTFILLEKEYKNWLEEMSGATQDKILSSSFALQRAASLTHLALDRGLDPKTLPVQNMQENNSVWPAPDYLLSFDEFFAEMTARLATQGELSDPAMTQFFKPVLDQYKKIFNVYPEFAKSEFGNNWKEFLQARALSFKVKEELEAAKIRAGKDLYDALRRKVDGLNPDNFAGLRQHLDRWNKGLSYGLNILQLEKLFPHVPQFKTYRDTVERWASYQRNFADKATETIESWRSLGKQEASALTDVLYEESEKHAYLPAAMLSKRLSGEALKVYTQIREQLSRVLEEMRATTLLEANREFSLNKEKLTAATTEINKEFDELKNSGYFPFIRFGDHTLTARAKENITYIGKSFKAGQLITFQAFESKSERDEAYSKMRKELGNKAAVSEGKMREAEYTVQGMPRSLLLGLRNRLLKDGHMTPDVEKSIEQSLQAAAPFKNFRNHFKKKKNIHGYSEDALRTFAHYIRSAAGNISRVRYAGEMRESIDSMQADVKTIQEIGGFSSARQNMADWLKRHFDYVMNPSNELAALRGVGFVAYLGFNVKSAFVNSMQMLTTTYPYLAARYGDVKAVSNIIKGQHFLKKWVFNKKAYINAKPGSIEERHAKLIAQGTSEGWLDQSLATELAIAASENTIDRSAYLPSGKRFWHSFSRWSALPFHLVEKTNRYVTAIAAYNLAYEETGNHEKGVLAAKLANQSTNFENARWNRPEFLRGKKSAALLFQNFIQNQLFFITKDPGSTRYLIMMLLLAGVMGLPGADDLADILDAAVTKLNKELGMKNPKTQLRVELRNFVNELGANPDLVLHGLSQDSFGLGQAGELTGIPIPHFDLSASIGMGNIVPGTNVPSMMMQSDPGNVALELGSQLTGASGNLVEDYYRGLFSKEPNDWKRVEKLLPLMSMRNLSKAARYAAEGKERAANGVVIADFTPYDTRTGLEIFGQSLGFPITEVTQGWERELAKRDMVQFYKVYQAAVQRNLNIAYMQEDREAIADAREALREYNSTVPMPEMGIKPSDAKRAVREYIKSQYKAGAGFEADRKFHRLSKLVEEAYPDPVGDSERNEPGFVP